MFPSWPPTSIPTCWQLLKRVYPIERVDKLSPERLRKFFLRGTGAQEGYVSVRPELKNMIQFQRINLLDQSYAVKGPLDVIFCRNVMIYFDKPTQYKILPASRR
jgi:chemotaxis protein methyltransferase CheR